MSTDQTPALARAIEALDETFDWLMPTDEYRQKAAPHVVSAALHVEEMALASCMTITSWSHHDATDDAPCSNCRESAEAIRVAILGGAS